MENGMHVAISLWMSDSNKSTGKVTADRIIDIVCKVTNIPIQSLFSKNREQKLVYARHVVRYLICINTKETLKDIGRKTGMCAHTTVIHSRQIVIDALKTKFNKITHILEQSEKILHGRKDDSTPETKDLYSR